MKEISLDQVDPSKYDVIITGGGAGGLLTALALTAEGKGAYRCPYNREF